MVLLRRETGDDEEDEFATVLSEVEEACSVKSGPNDRARLVVV
jgi:hypothetical protein